LLPSAAPSRYGSPMRTSLTAALAACLVLTACGEDPVAPDPLEGPLVGRWSGSHGGAIVEVGVTAPGTDMLGGCIAVGYDPVSRPLDRVTVRMGGARIGPAVLFAPEPGYDPIWSFTGTRQAVDTIIGSGSLGGGATSPVRLVRVSEIPGC